MREAWAYVWDVETTDEGRGQRRVCLVRTRERRSKGRLRSHTEVVERTVLFSRSFRPLLETPAMDHYRAVLQLLARHAEDEQFGCFVQTRSNDGDVEVILYDRWFDGTEIHTEELVRRAFDSGDGRSLVASAEFLADLQIWAERQNEERELAILSERDADQLRAQVARERKAAGEELSQLLADHAAAHTRER